MLPKLSVRDALPRVTVVWEEEIAAYVESEALVAVTKHVPAEVDVNTPLLKAQPVVDDPFATEYVIAPVPEPPEVVRVNGVPKVPEVLVIFNVFCGVSGGPRVVVPSDIPLYDAVTVYVPVAAKFSAPAGKRKVILPPISFVPEPSHMKYVPPELMH